MAYDSAYVVKSRSIDALQVLRAFAVVCVVLFHSGILFGGGVVFRPQEAGAAEFYRNFLFGHAGVDLFFVLSGFIIMHAHWDDAGTWERFVRYAHRRFVRIFPITLIVVLTTVALAMPLRLLFQDPSFLVWDYPRLLASLTLLPFSCEHIPGVLWSLNNELYFYCLFGLRYLSRALFGAALVGWTALVVVNAGMSFWPVLAACSNSPLSLYNSFFILGVATYSASIYMRAKALQGWAIALVLAGAGVFVVVACVDVINLAPVYLQDASFPSERVWKILVRGGYGGAGALLVVGAALLNWRAQSIVGRALCLVGDASFSIYIVHEFVVGLFGRALGRLEQASPWTTFAQFVLPGCL